ncbi:MAG: UDP-N-acetylmuramoyl-tripeptide--D-alanyl-D-alanine ligase [Pseudomonadota bacterium]
MTTAVAMMKLSEAATALHAELRGSDASFSGVSTDSRNVKAGDLFVALAGEKFDGHDYLAIAANSGAAAALVHKPMADSPLPLIVCKDTLAALGQLATYWRGKFNLPLVALTGSNGKTTVKEMLASILRAYCDSDAAVLATEGNLNNHIGMPLTLLKLRATHRFAVIEMGMNHEGEINYLTHLAKPQVALVNNAQRAHLGEVGGLEAVARAKGEIFSGLVNDGIAIINADDASEPLWKSIAHKYRQLTFALHQPADITAKFQLNATGTPMQVTTPHGYFSTLLMVPGEHNARNALAACAAAIALEIPLTAIAKGLSQFSGVKGRLQRKPGIHGADIIDDTYNANPDSLHAAIAVLSQSAGKKILVLGDMGELGADGIKLTEQSGAAAHQAGIDTLFTLGELSVHAARAFGIGAKKFVDLDELVATLTPMLDANTVVLVKGSRFMRMERVVDAITRPNLSAAVGTLDAKESK